MPGQSGFIVVALLVGVAALSVPAHAQVDSLRPRRGRRAEICQVQPPASAGAAATSGPSAVELLSQANAGGEDEDPCARRPALRFGLSYDYNIYNKFSRVAGDQPDIKTFSADDQVSGYGAFLEYFYDELCAWYWGVDYHTSTLHYVQTYDALHTPARVEGTVKGSFVSVYTGYDIRLPVLGAKLSPHIGLVRADNRLTAREFTLLSLYFTGYRAEVDYKTNLGMNIEIPLFGSHGGGRLSADYTTGGGSKDADRYWRVGAGVDVRLPFIF